jgi:peptide-methionine (S)-S-oxide reductase
MLKTILAMFLVMLFSGCSRGQDTKKVSTQVSQTNTNSIKKGAGENLETATLAGGCFWCIETIFEDLKGVDKVESGYAGGRVENPTYKEVCAGITGHAEVVQITFDPSVISYDKLLEIFFHIHNPTTLNKQGADEGEQYRSAIFYHNEAQKTTAEKVKKLIGESGLWNRPIVTEITPMDKFYSAEDYHQDYYKSNPEQGYCSMVIAPKVQKFYKEYKDYLKDGVGN